MNRIAVLLAAIAVLVLCRSVVAEIERVDWSDLEAAQQRADGKGTELVGVKAHYPDNSWKVKYVTWGLLNPDGGLGVTLLTPQARAFRWAALAHYNFETLDSSTFAPSEFNDGVLISVVRAEKEEMFERGDVLRMQRLICVTKADSVIEPISMRIDSTTLTNLAGASEVAADLEAVFPLAIFERGEDLRFYIFFENRKRKEIKFKAKDIQALR